MKKFISVLLIGILLQSCSSRIKSSLTEAKFLPLEQNTDVLLVDDEDVIPDNSDFVGDLKIGDTGFSTDCGYETALQAAKSAAREAGANLLKITKVKRPNLGSTCYRIGAEMYRNLSAESLSKLFAAREVRNASRLPKGADYAIVYFYRPRNYTGSAIRYKVRSVKDSIIGRAGNGNKFEYKMVDFGEQTFWGKTEAADSVHIDVQKGQEYFVRCEIKLGVAVGRPEMYLVENRIGIKEYEELD